MADPLDENMPVRPSPCAPWWRETPVGDTVVAELGDPR